MSNEFNQAMKEGIAFYERMLRDSPIQIKAQEYPIWFIFPLIIMCAISVFVFSKIRGTGTDIFIDFDNSISNEIFYHIPPAVGRLVDFVAVILISSVIIFLVRMMKGRKPVLQFDPKEDALSEIRRKLLGTWKIEHNHFSGKTGLGDFQILVEATLTAAKKLMLVIRKENSLHVRGDVQNISISLLEENTRIEILFLISHVIDSGEYLQKNFNYLYLLRWIRTDDGTAAADFTGNWYSLGDLGRDFGASGPCVMTKVHLPRLVNLAA